MKRPAAEAVAHRADEDDETAVDAKGSASTPESADNSIVGGTSSGAHTVQSLVRSFRVGTRTQRPQAVGS